MRTEYCRTKINEDLDKWVEKGCITEETKRELGYDQKFRDDHKGIDLSMLSTSTLLPLRRERDDAVVAEVISLKESLGNLTKTKLGTASKMKAAIRKAKQKLDKDNLVVDITKEPIKGQYNTILIDPPWDYGDSDNTRGGTQYSTLTIDKLQKIDLPTSENCMLFLWTVDRFYCEAKELLKGWGFNYKNTIIWDKINWGVGYFIRPQHEYLLLGIKGDVKVKAMDVPSVIREAKREHSRKPEVSYQVIERMSYEPRVEIFAREERKGWKK